MIESSIVTKFNIVTKILLMELPRKKSCKASYIQSLYCPELGRDSVCVAAATSFVVIQDV